MSYPHRKTRAFTLVELVAVMVVMGTLGTIAAAIVTRLGAANTQTAVRTELYNDASMALDRIVGMIKFTPVRAATTQTPAISSITSSQINWQNGDQLNLATNVITLRSVRDGDGPATTPVLTRNVAALTITPRNDAEQSLFTVHSVTNLNAAQSGQVHAMDVAITLARSGVTATLSTRVFLRANAELAAP
jgi:prepilin-type N-terminal cleavage/methylation domain-containing protein